jgi:hypothetical protein
MAHATFKLILTVVILTVEVWEHSTLKLKISQKNILRIHK